MQDLVYTLDPTVAVFGDDAAARDDAARHVAALGARVGMSVPIGDALARMELQAADAVLVLAGDTSASALTPLLDRLVAAAGAGMFRSVVVLPNTRIDIVSAYAWHDDVDLICEGSKAEVLAALSLALAPPEPLTLRETDESPAELRRLREEVGRIARALADMSGDETVLAPPPAPAPTEPRPPVALGPVVRAMIRSRRQRDQFFPTDLFADPAWDMILDLMLARLERRLVSVSSLCIASAVPPTTALRWIKRLTDEGLFIRASDPRDGRRIFIDLSEETARQATAFLTNASSVWTLAG